MTRLFDVVRELSGQGSVISTPRPYIKFCEGNHTHAAVLSQLVFWSSTKPDGEWFYKSNDELGEELCLSSDQVRYAIRQLKKRLEGVIHSKVRKANGVPTTHYQIDGNKLVDLLFPKNEPNSQMEMGKLPDRNEPQINEHNSQMDSVNLPDGNGIFPKLNWEDYQNHGSGNFTDSINRSKPDPNEQISDVPSELKTDEKADPILFEIPLKGKSALHQVTQSQVSELRELYPAVDVPQQIRNMIGWCQANPTRQKTASGIKRFIHSWLCKEQDKGYVVSAHQPTQNSDEKSVLKRKIRQLEMDINNENSALISFQQRKSPASNEAVKSAERKLKTMMAEREELIKQLGRINGE